jgi:hypothetical protein
MTPKRAYLYCKGAPWFFATDDGSEMHHENLNTTIRDDAHRLATAKMAALGISGPLMCGFFSSEGSLPGWTLGGIEETLRKLG